MTRYCLKVKKVHPDAVIPFYARPLDAGLDLCSVTDVLLESGKVVLVPTGIQIELPPATEGQIRPRSGLALKNSITVLNSPGTVDEGFRGEIEVLLINLGKDPYYVRKGDKVAQLVIKPVARVDIKEVECLAPSERAADGFGSTGS